MAPKKLTEADKTSILSLYRQPQETTSTLAERYGVSNSTISRLLKASLPEDEYSLLIQQKRGAPDRVIDRVSDRAADQALELADAPVAQDAVAPEEVALDAVAPEEVAQDAVAQDAVAQDEATAKAKPRRRTTAEPEPEVATPAPLAEAASLAVEDVTPPAKPTRKRRSQAAEPAALDPEPEVLLEEASEGFFEIAPELPEVDAATLPESTQLSLPDPAPAAAPEKPARPVLKSAQPVAPLVPDDEEAEVVAKAAVDLDDDWDDDADAMLGDDYDDDDEDSDDDEAFPWESGDRATSNLEALEISPLTAEVLPPLCYVVVERTSSELVVLPLRTFAELGQIPEAEGDSRTLPVFENHNVARRFSRRNQRVVKVPDGTLLQTTSPYLQAKGITRLFIDGQVFSLGEDPVAPAVPATDN